ncbi:MAG TPA: type II toxin-antitoxin system HicB family antitoxin [Candidatus Nanoarchaeia archaeon]|nr:type II toxin-antitoxin system HicB family antitoxin [Candidatus Nanoarchaeia archaeon]
MASLTAIIKKGEKQFVALCPELDVVSQGYTIEEALANLKEASELYIEEMGIPKDVSTINPLITQFEVKTHEKIAQAIRQRSNKSPF